MMNFNENDQQLLINKGISEKKVLEQVETFKEGIPFVKLEKAAVVSDGILKFSEEEEEELIQKFDSAKTEKSLLKFVPASGAASRMFKSLFNFIDAFNPVEESYDEYIERTDDSAIKAFFDGVQDFPFYKTVKNVVEKKASTENEEKHLFVKYMMEEEGLNFGFYPKGLLPFHTYDDSSVTPFEEHLKEASFYAKSGGNANLHFTISEQHGKMFNEEFNTVGKKISESTETSFKVGYSFQKMATDTIAVDMDNEPFRNADDSLLFRPGGHGALIENLDEQNADIIFIKNIDNVVVSKFADEVGNSKKILAGFLLQVQEKAFKYALLLENSEISFEQTVEIKEFLINKLNVRFTNSYDSYSLGDQIEILKDKINRPIRVCGMVKNQGEPGGGPFWVKARKF